jgi:fungal nitric oxide reductase
MVEPIFVKDHIESMKPYIQKTVETLLDQMIATKSSGPADLIGRFALPVPSYVRH